MPATCLFTVRPPDRAELCQRQKLRYAIPTRSVTAWEPFRLKCSPRMNRGSAKLLALGKQLQPREQARSRLRRKIDARSARGVFALQFAESRDVGAKRRGLMRPVESRMKYWSVGALYTSPKKTDLGLFRRLWRRNSARLCRDLGAEHRGLMRDFQTLLRSVWKPFRLKCSGRIRGRRHFPYRYMFSPRELCPLRGQSPTLI